MPPAAASARAAIDPLAVHAVLIAVRQAADVLCDRWSLTVLLLAHAGFTRFADLRQRSGMATRQLGSRLTTLQAQEILVRLPYTRRPLRHGYHLTPMGLDLFDVLATLLRWTQDHHPRDHSLRLLHTPCGAWPLAATLRCAGCGDALAAHNVGRQGLSQRALAAMPGKATAYRRSSARTASPAGQPAALLDAVLQIFGDKWSIELIVCALLRVGTFSGFQAATGIATNVLTDRLARLQAQGILRHDPADAATGPYGLTARGLALYPILLAIQPWADAWLPDRLLSPLRLKHRGCGKPLQLALVCDTCGEPVKREQAQWQLA